MSSTYRILCMSHDPATLHGDYHSAEDAAADIAAGVYGHPHCDLMIGRWSGAFVELGCPGSHRPRPGQRACWGHRSTEWADAAWLRVLALVHQQDSDTARKLTGQTVLLCWSWDRLRRLLDELGIEPEGTS